MGYFYYLQIGKKFSPDEVEGVISSINEELWGDKYGIKRGKEIPITPKDSRKAKWAFCLNSDEFAGCDAAFTMTLLKDGRMEFKVPRSKWDEFWEDQQMVRRHLAKRLNKLQ